MVDVNSVKRKIEVVVKQYFKNQGYDSSEIRESNLYTIEHDHNADEKYTDFYVYAETPVEDFFSISEDWNEVVEKFDPSAYFDVVSPGIYLARIYWGQESTSTSYEMTKEDLERFGNAIVEDLSSGYDEDFWADIVRFNKSKNLFTIKVSSKNYLSKISTVLDFSGISSYKELEELYLDAMVEALEVEMKEL